MHIAFAIISALLAGSGDFCGGLGSRSNPVSSVGITSLGIGLLTALVLAPTLGGQLDQAAIVWGAVAGIAGGLAILFLYEGFTRSEVAIVSPVAAVGSATWPLIYAIASGERPGLIRLVGLAIGLVAILLIGFQSSGDRKQIRDGVLLGSVAGLGFGSMLICLSLTGARLRNLASGTSPRSRLCCACRCCHSVGQASATNAIDRSLRWRQLLVPVF